VYSLKIDVWYVYSELEWAVADDATDLERVEDPHHYWDLCFQTSHYDSDLAVKTAHFQISQNIMYVVTHIKN